MYNWSQVFAEANFQADFMNATQISTQLSPLNLLSLLKSSLKQILLHETMPSQFESTY